MPQALHLAIGAACTDDKFREELFKNPTTIDKVYNIRLSDSVKDKLKILTASPKLKDLLAQAEQIICSNNFKEPLNCEMNRLSTKKGRAKKK
jgi:hypothetical protein